MELHFTSKLEEYYQKFIELQEQLKKSEEQRFMLEMKFNEMVQVAKEEEQQHYRKLRAQYKRFLEEDKKRQDRNERIIRNLERIETRIAMLSAKTDRINLLRKQYQNFLLRMSNGSRQRKPPGPGISRERSFIKEEPIKEQRANLFKDDYSLPQRRQDTFELGKSLFEHPTVKKALQKDQSNEEKIEILDRYLQSLSSQRCRDLLNQEKEAREKLSSSTQQDIYWKGEPSATNHATSIADDIMNSIYSRYYNKNDGLNRGSQLNLGKIGQNDNKKVLGVTNVFDDVNNSTTSSKLEGNPGVPSRSLKNEAGIAGEIVSPIIDTERVTSTVEVVPEPNLGDFVSRNGNEENPDQIECNVASYDTIKLTQQAGDSSRIKLEEQTKDSCKDDNILVSSMAAKNDEALTTESKDTSESKKEVSLNEQSPIVEKKNEDKVSNKPELVCSDTDKNPVELQQNDSVINQNGDHIQNIELDQNVPIKLDDSKQLLQNNHDNLLESPQVNSHERLGDDHLETIEDTDKQPNAIKAGGNQDIGDNNVVQHQVYDSTQNNNYQENDSTQQNDYYNTDQMQEQPQELYEQGSEQQIPYEQTDSAYQQHYDENGQPIQYDEHGQVIPQDYDQYGQFVLYDQNGQMVQPQYDQHGQIIPQYDESGQLIMLYDQNGQQQYDENGQPFLQYDASGQPVYNLDETNYNYANQDGFYQEEAQVKETENEFYQVGNQEYSVPEEDTQLKENSQEGNQEYSVQLKEAEPNEAPVTKVNSDNHETNNAADVLVKEESEIDSAKPNDDAMNKDVEKVAKVMDILDTDTESSKQNTSKISNDTDFDFS